MNRQNQQVYISNKQTVVLPTLFALLFVAASVLGFATPRVGRVHAQSSTSCTSTTNKQASVTCLAPASSTTGAVTDKGNGGRYARSVQPILDITQNTTEIISTVTSNYYDGFKTVSRATI